MADDCFADFRIKKAGHCLAHLVNKLVNDAVKLDLDSFLAGGGIRAVLHLDAETDDDRV